MQEIRGIYPPLHGNPIYKRGICEILKRVISYWIYLSISMEVIYVLTQFISLPQFSTKVTCMSSGRIFRTHFHICTTVYLIQIRFIFKTLPAIVYTLLSRLDFWISPLLQSFFTNDKTQWREIARQLERFFCSGFIVVYLSKEIL